MKIDRTSAESGKKQYYRFFSIIEDEELRNLLRSKVSSIEILKEENASLGVVKPELLDVKIE